MVFYKGQKQDWTHGRKGQGNGIAFILSHASYEGEDCVLWPYSTDYNGYGQFGYNGELLRAHKFMCELVHGQPPSPELEASHSCGVAACINPKHLSWETHSDNEKLKRKHGTAGGGARRPDGNGGNRTYLTAEQIADIRANRYIVPAKELAEKHGIKRGGVRYWQETTHEPLPRGQSISAIYRQRAKMRSLG